MRQSGGEYKLAAIVIFTVALLLRAASDGAPPFDDAYHAKRIASFPSLLEFDVDRGEDGAFTPWPPLYDLSAGAIQKLFGGTSWLPPIAFALFAAAVTLRLGPLGGLALALSPYLISISRKHHIDHHFLEPSLVLAILWSTLHLCGGGRPRPPLRAGRWPENANAAFLATALIAALFVQPAMLIAAGLAFIAIFFFGDARRGAIAFAIAALAVAIYRITRPDGYPDSAWFLGYPHAATLAGAAIACALRDTSRVLALAAGTVAALAIPSTAGAFLAGAGFLAGDPWLRSIAEFQPMFRNSSSIITDAINLGAGSLIALTLWRRHRVVALFAIAYLILSLTSRRFLVPAVPIFAVAASLAMFDATTRAKRAAIAIAMLLPPALFLAIEGNRPVSYDHIRSLAADLRALPRGRVLAPWSFGHAIDVLGGQPVIIDNFGSMPSEAVFANASDALLTTHVETLRNYCRTRDIRYLVLPHPLSLGGVAEAIGVDPSQYGSSALARRTVWWRLYDNREPMMGFEPIRGGAVKVWRVTR